MRVLAIDPGYDRVGVAVVEKKPRSREILIYSDCIQTSAQAPFEERLVVIGETLEEVLTTHQPGAVAIEKLYFQKNQKTAMLVAEARGAVRYIVATHKLPVYEYTPLEIKMAVAGDGHGSKDQVIRMIPHLVKIDKDIKYDDEYDAIAVGLTYLAIEGGSTRRQQL